MYKSKEIMNKKMCKKKKKNDQLYTLNVGLDKISNPCF
jgi:hypothetical protein